MTTFEASKTAAFFIIL